MKPPACDTTVASLLRHSDERYGSRTALVYRDRRWSFAELARTIEVSAGMIAAVAGRGHRVAVIAPGSDRTVIALLAVMAAGAIAVPLHPDLPESRLREILDDCDPALVLVDEPACCAAAGGDRRIERLAWMADQPQQSSRTVEMSPPDPDDVAAIFYTSGSTSTPRGVVCRHRQMIFCTGAINSVIGNQPDDVILSTSPLSFDYGFYQVLLALASGAALVVAGPGGLATMLPSLVVRERVSGLPLVPSVIGALLHSQMLGRLNVPSLRYITSTGDVLPPAHIAAVRAALPHVTVIPMYGLTECKRVSILPPGRLQGRERSVGLPLPGTTVSIVTNDGRLAAANEVGELHVRGPHLTDGYWRDPAATAQRFAIDPATGERVLRTGDLFTQDDDGFLYFVSRASGIIKSHGERVGAGEVEAIISRYPGVAEVAAVGAKSGVAGEVVVAFVAAADGNPIDVAGLQAHCAESLTMAARPVRFIVSFNLLPRTSNGKIDRRALRDDATRMLSVP